MERKRNIGKFEIREVGYEIFIYLIRTKELVLTIELPFDSDDDEILFHAERALFDKERFAKLWNEGIMSGARWL